MDPNMTVVANFAANCTATVGKILGDIGVANAVNDLTEVLCAMKASTEAAQEAADGVGGSLDGSFMLANTYLVFFMQAGFAMLCAGSVRSKNCMNILLKNVLDACFGAPMYWAFGYAFAYGEGSSTNGFIGNNDFFLDDFTDWPFFIFQWAFAAATATIVSGSVAERCTFQAYIIYSMFLTGFVYPVVSHWIWASQGWLSAFNPDALVWDSGMIDFAGSGVVHMTGGFAGLMGAAIIGPRSGRFQSDGSPSPNFQGHSVTLVVLGTFILWFGWYGFNPGSMLAINGAVETVSRTAVTTTISAAAGGVSSLMWNFGKSKTWDLSQACNGVLSGLVGITAGCSVVDPAAALLIGALSGVLFDLGSTMLLKLKIDDPLGAAPMHGFCGAFGVIMVGLFARKEYVVQAYAPSGQIQYGMFFGGGWKLLGCQFLGVFSIMAWVCTLIGGIFMIMKAAGILRVPVDEEILGLDISHHGGKAYNLDENTVTSTEMSAR